MNDCNLCKKKTEIIFTSKTNLLEGCDTILEFLRTRNVESKIYSNKVVKCNSKYCWADKECKIVINDKDYYECKKIWDDMQKKFNLSCGYLTHNEQL